jgi:ferredoxin--NADP+ reductase
VIGTNKKDAQETIDNLFADVDAGKVPDKSKTVTELDSLVDERDPRHVTWEGWGLIDEAEQARGEQQGRPRVKFARVEEMRDTVHGPSQERE